MAKRKLRKSEREALERAETAVFKMEEEAKISRAAPKSYSKQDRFSSRFFSSVLHWTTRLEAVEPSYDADSRRRDDWLRQYVRAEPHLVGVLASVTQVDKNRGWILEGGRNQVKRYAEILHSSELAPGMAGWRPFIEGLSQAYYSSDMGAVVEIGKEGKRGPMRRLYFVDPVECKTTGDPEFPLEFGGARTPQPWRYDDYFRMASMVSTDQEYHGLGFCAVSRCIELAKIMVAVYRHDQEKLAAKMPEGLLLLHGIEDDQWEEALQERDAQLTGLEREYFGGVITLASAGTEEISANLVALSQLPDQFDRKTVTDLMMYGYALAFGYDPREFWPVSSGALGTATETQVQHVKATGKGGLDFVTGLQEQIQKVIPESVAFTFEQRDAQGELMDAELRRAKVEAVVAAYAPPNMAGPLISRDEARQLLVAEDIIPTEWTEPDEPGRQSDKERLVDKKEIRRAIALFPDEPIVRYCYRWIPGVGPATVTRTLFQTGTEALEADQRYWAMKRRRKPDEGEVLYEGDGVVITEADVDDAITQVADTPELKEILEAEALDDKKVARGGILGWLVRRGLRRGD